MSVIKNRAGKGQEVWVTKTNLLSLLPKQVSERIIRNAVTNALGGNIPRLIPSKATWDTQSNDAWHKASLWIQEKAEAYSQLHGLGEIFVRGSDIRVYLQGGRGEATCIQSDWGLVLSQYYKLPIKWRFKSDSLAYVPALFAELNKLAGELPAKYESENAFHAVNRRRNRRTVLALRRSLGFIKGSKFRLDDPREDVFTKNSSYSLDKCLRSEWPSSKHTKKVGKVGVDLTISGNHASHISCDLRLNFSIHDEKLRNENNWKLQQLFKAVRDLTDNQERKENDEAIPAS
jgi:hypothetical protein